MAKKIIFLMLFIVGSQAWPQATGLSAYRKPGVTYRNYLGIQSDVQRSPSVSTAELAAGPWNKLDINKMEEWKSFQTVEEAFKKVRDTRFLSTLEKPKFLRRSTWLYPRDGCFARAGLAVKNLMDWKYPAAYKIFVFGDLTVNTDNYPLGQVTWWFHVVPAVRFGPDIYILDPAIEPQKPLLLKRWLETMTPDLSQVNVALCDAQTYSPGDTCHTAPDLPLEDWGQSDQESFLDTEWFNLKYLKRDPEKELGDFPPWLAPSAPAPMAF